MLQQNGCCGGRQEGMGSKGTSLVVKDESTEDVRGRESNSSPVGSHWTPTPVRKGNRVKLMNSADDQVEDEEVHYVH